MAHNSLILSTTLQRPHPLLQVLVLLENCVGQVLQAYQLLDQLLLTHLTISTVLTEQPLLYVQLFFLGFVCLTHQLIIRFLLLAVGPLSQAYRRKLLYVGCLGPFLVQQFGRWLHVVVRFNVGFHSLLDVLLLESTDDRYPLSGCLEVFYFEGIVDGGVGVGPVQAPLPQTG